MLVDVLIFCAKSQLVFAFLVLAHVEEQNEARNLFPHTVDTTPAHYHNLLALRHPDRAFKVESIELVRRLKHFEGKVHLLVQICEVHAC